MREIIRTEILAILPASDVVVKSRPDAFSANLYALRNELSQVLIEIQRLLT